MFDRCVCGRRNRDTPNSITTPMPRRRDVGYRTKPGNLVRRFLLRPPLPLSPKRSSPKFFAEETSEFLTVDEEEFKVRIDFCGALGTARSTLKGKLEFQ